VTVPECLSCGTCCFSTLETYVRVTGEDHARLGERAEALTTFVGNRAYMRMTDGHCAALRVDPEAGRFVCTVYEARPSTCRELERGSPECLGELATKGDRPRRYLISCRDRRCRAPHPPRRG
jgi:Fe-S-cluster containining protein